MTGQTSPPLQSPFQGMASLVLDVDFFTSEYRLCDKIADYFADLVARSHEDPARYGNMSTALINEVVELVFRSARGGGKIEFSLSKGEDSVRLRVGFRCGEQGQALLATLDGTSGVHRPDGMARDLAALAQAVDVDVMAEADEDDRISMIVDFVRPEGSR